LLKPDALAAKRHAFLLQPQPLLKASGTRQGDPPLGGNDAVPGQAALRSCAAQR
jgi:hypothetical protein